MNFELTISGLCVIVLRSPDERPTQPTAVDVLCVGGAHHDHHDHSSRPLHQPRLSYLPGQVQTEHATAELVVGPDGERIAFLDLTDQALALGFRETPYTEFSVTWGPADREAPSSRDEDTWMNWVPAVQDLGFEGLRLGQPGELVSGAGAVISLPKGELAARNVVRKPGTEEPFLWKFSGNGEAKKRAVANEVVFTAWNVDDVYFLRNGKKYLESSMAAGATLRMAVSNDLASVTPDYNDGIDALKHLDHIGALAASRPAFQQPKLFDSGRTGHPICNQALYVTNA